MNCNDLVQTHYYRDIQVSDGKTPCQTAIEEIQKELDQLIIVYPTDTDEVVQQKINTPNVSKVIFATGTYTNITTTKLIPSNKTLFGYGAKIIMPKKMNRLLIFTNDTDGSVGVYDANTNINIFGFEFDCSANIENSGDECMGFLHANNITISDCKFKNMINTVGHFMEFCACKDVVIDNCFFYNYQGGTEMLQIDIATDEGVLPGAPGPWDWTATKDVVISNCFFENPKDYTTSRTANVAPAAIGCHNKVGGANPNHIKIVDNTFANVTTAIKFNRLVSSVISNNSSYGVYNFFSSGAELSEVSTANYSGNIISNNSINCAALVTTVTADNSYCYTAIAYNGSSSVINGNQVYSASGDGIQIRGKENIVNNNKVISCGRSGINLVNASDIQVTGNHCMFNMNKGVATDDADIRFQGGTGCNVSSNFCYKFYCYADNTSSLVQSNVVTGTLNNTGGTVHNNLVNGVWTA